MTFSHSCSHSVGYSLTHGRKIQFKGHMKFSLHLLFVVWFGGAYKEFKICVSSLTSLLSFTPLE